MEEILALLIPIVFILAGATVLILRPITKRLGETLHQVQQERREARLDQTQIDQVRALVESVQERLELIEQRQSFFEKLVETRSEQSRLVERGDEAGR